MSPDLCRGLIRDCIFFNRRSSNRAGPVNKRRAASARPGGAFREGVGRCAPFLAERVGGRVKKRPLMLIYSLFRQIQTVVTVKV